MRDVYYHAANNGASGSGSAGATPSLAHAREVLLRHVCLARGHGTNADLVALLRACVAAVCAPAAPLTLMSEQLSFATSVLRASASNSKPMDTVTRDGARACVVAAGLASAARAAHDAGAAIDAAAATAHTVSVAAALRAAEAAVARHAAAAAQLRFLGWGLEHGQHRADWSAGDELADVYTRCLCEPLAERFDAALAAAADGDAAAADGGAERAAAAAALAAALTPAAARHPATWLLARRTGVMAGAMPAMPPITLLLSEEARPPPAAAGDVLAAAFAGSSDAIAAAVSTTLPEESQLAAPETVAVPLSAAAATRCMLLVKLAHLHAALHGGSGVPDDAAAAPPLCARVHGVLAAVIPQLETAAAALQALPPGDAWEGAQAWAGGMHQGTLFETILTSNALCFKEAVDITCLCVANMIKGKSPEEIRQTFNIKNDFTPVRCTAHTPLPSCMHTCVLLVCAHTAAMMRPMRVRVLMALRGHVCVARRRRRRRCGAKTHGRGSDSRAADLDVQERHLACVPAWLAARTSCVSLSNDEHGHCRNHGVCCTFM
jgi:hypothetical protein